MPYLKAKNMTRKCIIHHKKPPTIYPLSPSLISESKTFRIPKTFVISEVDLAIAINTNTMPIIISKYPRYFFIYGSVLRSTGVTRFCGIENRGFIATYCPL